ncbi:PREDICTED: endothelin-3 [Ficedula albicollis]|uniref:endothelin-3 n=1 Tax=Ficedula albicollis TaxID=59894 RepID=UPI0007AD941B|nr:PREDICTED: endothelin-3 [Ficedula albicollis]
MSFSDNNVDYKPLKSKSCSETEVPATISWCAAAQNRISHRKVEPYKEDYLGDSRIRKVEPYKEDYPGDCNSRRCVPNMMQRTVPYGLSNYRGSFRGKRSTGQTPSTSPSSFRCSCSDAQDKQCLQFCRRVQDRRSFNIYLLELRNKNLNYNSPLRWTNLMLQCDASGEFSSRQHFHFSSATEGMGTCMKKLFSPRESLRKG